jgi:hypothetical protein
MSFDLVWVVADVSLRLDYFGLVIVALCSFDFDKPALRLYYPVPWWSRVPGWRMCVGRFEVHGYRTG